MRSKTEMDSNYTERGVTNLIRRSKLFFEDTRNFNDAIFYDCRKLRWMDLKEENKLDVKVTIKVQVKESEYTASLGVT
jgi:hypothetical protein